MRVLIVASTLLAALLWPSTAATAAGSSLPTCPGVRVARVPVYAKEFKGAAAYIHVFHDAGRGKVCAFLNSSASTWGVSKHMTIQLKQCSRPSSGYGGCPGQLQSKVVRGWYSGRTGTVTLDIGRGCALAWGRVSWGPHYGLMATKTVACVAGAEGAGARGAEGA